MLNNHHLINLLFGKLSESTQLKLGRTAFPCHLGTTHTESKTRYNLLFATQSGLRAISVTAGNPAVQPASTHSLYHT